MKCSKCNKEIDDVCVFCPFCGAEIKSEEIKEENIQAENEQEKSQLVAEEPVVETKEVVEESSENLKDDTEEVKEKIQEEPEKIVEKTTIVINEKDIKKRHSIITIAILAAVVVIVAVIGMIIFGSKSAEQLYENVVKSVITDLYAGDATTAKSANVSVSAEMSTDINEIKDLINGLKLSTNVQYNLETKQAVLGLAIDKNNDSYLNAQGMVDLNQNEAYITESNLYSKVIKTQIPTEYQDLIKEYLGEDDEIVGSKSVAKKASRKIYKTINKNLNKELYSREKATLTINGKNKKVKDNILTITSDQLKGVIENTTKSLKMDNDFLACYKDRNQIIDALDTFEDLADELDGLNEKYVVHYYTSGMTNSFVGLNMVTIDEYEDESIVEVIKTSNKVYEINIKEKIDGILENLGTINLTINKNNKNQKDIVLSMNMKDVGNFALNLKTTSAYNKGINILDTTNAVDYQDLTDEDIEEIYNNFTNSKLYEVVATYLDEITEMLGLSHGTDSSSDRNVPAGVIVGPGQSFVKSYDEDVVVFDVPASFEEEYAGLSYQRFSKDSKTKETAYIDVDCNFDTLEEYEETIEDIVKSYKEEEGYTNVKLSDREEIKVGENTFYKKNFEYSYKSGSSSYTSMKTYYYIPITEEYVYSIEIDDEDKIVTNQDIEKLLTIEVTLHKEQ